MRHHHRGNRFYHRLRPGHGVCDSRRAVCALREQRGGPAAGRRGRGAADRTLQRPAHYQMEAPALYRHLCDDVGPAGHGAADLGGPAVPHHGQGGAVGGAGISVRHCPRTLCHIPADMRRGIPAAEPDEDGRIHLRHGGQ